MECTVPLRSPRMPVVKVDKTMRNDSKRKEQRTRGKNNDVSRQFSFHGTIVPRFRTKEFIEKKEKRKKETFADWFLIACAPAIAGFALSKHVICLRGTFRAWITASCTPLTCFIHLPLHTLHDYPARVGNESINM